MPFTDFGNTLTALRKSKHYLQDDVIRLMHDCGAPVTKSTYSRWERNQGIPQADQFLTLCQIFGVRDILGTFAMTPRFADPLSKEGRRKVEEYEQILIASNMFAPAGKVLPFRKRQRPVYEEEPVSAGTGQFLDNPNYTMMDIGEEVPDCVDFGVRVSGDSMEPTFVDGQIVWIQQREVIEDGEIGIFYLNGQSFIKKLKTTKDGVKLVSLNAEKYAPIVIKPNDDFRAFGKVIY